MLTPRPSSETRQLQRFARAASYLPLGLVIATLCIAVTGCGGKASPSVAHLAQTTKTSHAQGYTRPSPANLLAASKCMRSHGVPNFPNPVSYQGHLVFGFYAGSGVDSSTPAYKSAYSLCATRYLGLSHRSTPAERALWHTEALRYSQCIRAHGLTDFPDPGQGGAIDLTATPDGLKTPIGQRAQQACKPLLLSGVIFIDPS